MSKQTDKIEVRSGQELLLPDDMIQLILNMLSWRFVVEFSLVCKEMQTRAFRARSYFNLSPSSLPVVARKLFPRCTRLKEISISATFLGNFVKTYNAQHFRGLEKTLEVLEINGSHPDLPKFINLLPKLPLLKRLSLDIDEKLVPQILAKVSSKLTHLATQMSYTDNSGASSTIQAIASSCPGLQQLRLSMRSPEYLTFNVPNVDLLPAMSRALAPLRGLADLQLLSIDEETKFNQNLLAAWSDGAARGDPFRSIWTGTAQILPLNLPSYIFTHETQERLVEWVNKYPPTRWNAEQVFRVISSIRSQAKENDGPEPFLTKVLLLVGHGMDLGLIQKGRPLLLALLHILPSVRLLNTFFFEPQIQDPLIPGRMITPIQNLQQKYPGLRISDYDTLYATTMTSPSSSSTNTIEIIEWLKRNANNIAEASGDSDLVGNAHMRDSSGALPHQRRYHITPDLMEYLFEQEKIDPDETFLKAQLERPYNLGLILRAKPNYLSFYDDIHDCYIFATVVEGILIAKATLSATYKMLDLIGAILDAVDAQPKLGEFIKHLSVKRVVKNVFKDVLIGKEDQFGQTQTQIWRKLQLLVERTE